MDIKKLEDRGVHLAKSVYLSTELRLGNHILLYRYFIEPNYIKQRIESGFHIDQILRGEWLAEGEPLTDQWFEDFKFISREPEVYELNNLYFMREHGSDVWSVDVGSEEDAIEIKYVHELQNLCYAFYKIELVK